MPSSRQAAVWNPQEVAAWCEESGISSEFSEARSRHLPAACAPHHELVLNWQYVVSSGVTGEVLLGLTADDVAHCEDFELDATAQAQLLEVPTAAPEVSRGCNSHPAPMTGDRGAAPAGRPGRGRGGRGRRRQSGEKCGEESPQSEREGARGVLPLGWLSVLLRRLRRPPSLRRNRLGCWTRQAVRRP